MNFGTACFISVCKQASFLTGRNGLSRLIPKRRRVTLGRGQSASKLVWRRTVAGPELGTPNGPDELAIGRLFRLGLDRGVPAGGRRRLCEGGADKCKHEKYCRNCAFHSSYLDAVRCDLVPDPPKPEHTSCGSAQTKVGSRNARDYSAVLQPRMFSRGRIVAMVDYGRVGALAPHIFGGGGCRGADPLA